MKRKSKLRYSDSGVVDNQALGLDALLKELRPTEQFRSGMRFGKSVLDIGYFANVVEFGPNLGLALTTDGVGTKVLVAEMLDKYDTIGIDCVAMNANDLICVGAEPVSMLDYIAVEIADGAILKQIGRGLKEGARQARVNIVGGEISQIKEIIRGSTDGKGIDLVGMCVGVVGLDKVNVGQDVRAGDVIIGLRSSGIHCNGLTLARKALFETAFKPDSYSADLGRSVGEELLEPTLIYVEPIMELLRSNVPLKAMINITGDGFLNLTRIKPAVSFRLSSLPKPQAIFHLIQKAGDVDDAEMFRVFNMGIGFCVIVPPDSDVIRTVKTVAEKNKMQTVELGEVFADDRRLVEIPQKELVGCGERFLPKSQLR